MVGCVENGAKIKGECEEINSKLFKCNGDGFIYYECNYVDSLLGGDSRQYCCILGENGKCYDGFDLETFADFGTFWFDKNAVYFLEDFAGGRKVRTVSANSLKGSCYFRNAHYWLDGKKAGYWGHGQFNTGTGVCMWDSSATFFLEKKIQVLKLSNELNDPIISPYAIVGDRYFFHGCEVDLNILPEELVQKLQNARENSSYEDCKCF
jgi:hypothetical protein